MQFRPRQDTFARLVARASRPRVIRLIAALTLIFTSAIALAQSTRDAETLWRDVVVYRDEWGVPHVYADTPRAMAFGFGYAQAEDHIERMLVAFRETNGRASEIFGAESIESDRTAIQLAHADLARDAWEFTDRITADLCEGFALGVNTWITDHPGQAPEWAEGIHPADVLALLHRVLLSQAPFDLPDATLLDPVMPSANAWAVASNRSTNGNAMLVVNPHVNYDRPQQWYEAHLVTRDLDVYGATLYGLPVLLVGHNDTLGWALAPNQPDIADVYAEIPMGGFAPNPKSLTNRRPARAPSVPYTLDRPRSFYVWTPRGYEENRVRQRQTPRGPIVAHANGFEMSWRVGGYTDFGAIRQLYDMGRATSLDAFRRAIDRQQLSSFHVVYADTTGNIFYQYNATTRERPDPRLATGKAVFASADRNADDLYTYPLTTRDAAFEWGEPVGPDRLPWLLNPDTGYLQASGTVPWLATSPSVLNPDNWPPWLVRDRDSYRAKRVRRLFGLGPRSFDDMQAMLFDTVAPLAAESVPFLLDVAEAYPEYVARAHPDLQVGLDMLREWNYLTEPGSLATTYFHVWWSVLRLNNQGEAWPDEWIHRLIQEGAPWFQEHTLRSAETAAELLRNEFQTMNVPWGEVHRIRRGSREEPIGGSASGSPIFHVGDRLYERGAWRVNESYGFAMVVEFGETPRAVSLVPFGSSEQPESDHFDDQLDLFLSRRLKVTRFDRRDVERHARQAHGARVQLRPPHQRGSVFVQSDRGVDVRLAESAKTPGALPEATAAFTTYIEPRIDSAPGPVSVEVALRVDETVCANTDLATLLVYAYHPVTGWRPLEHQTLDADRRMYIAQTGGSGVYAVLGPRKALRGSPLAVPPEPTRAEQPQLRGRAGAPSPAPLQDRRPAPLSDPLSRAELTHVARNDDASVTDLETSDRERVARLFPATPQPEPAPQQQPLVSRQRPENVRGGNYPVVTPQIPPGFEPPSALRIPPDLSDVQVTSPSYSTGLPGNTQPGERLLPQNPFVQRQTFAQKGPAPAATSTPQPDPRDDPAPEAEPLQPDTTPEPIAEPMDRERIAKVPAQTPADSQPEPVETPPRDDENNGRVLFSDQSPSEILGLHRQPDVSRTLDLAPDPSRASPLRFGTNIELRTPDNAGTFIVRTQQTVRAQAYIADRPARPFPDGLRACSPTYEILADPQHVAGNTAVTIRVSPADLGGAAPSQLSLYVLDGNAGWIPLPGARANTETLRFTGIDFALRSYAVLGPAR